LAAWMDFGEKFATVTRELQGEGVEVIMGTYEKMEALRRYCLSPTFPSAQAILNTAGMAYDYRFTTKRQCSISNRRFLTSASTGLRVFSTQGQLVCWRS